MSTVVINGEERDQDAGMTLKRLRVRFPDCWLQQGRRDYDSDDFVLENGVKYELKLPTGSSNSGEQSRKIRMDHIFIFGDNTLNPSGEPISTAVSVGPRLILTCAHCLTTIATRTRGSLIYNEHYWVQPSIKMERSGQWSNVGRISVTLFKYHLENDWALLIRTDDTDFRYFTNIDMTPSALGDSQLPHLETVDVLHCPVKLLLDNFETHAEEYTLHCNRLVNSVVQTHSSHHVYYDSRGITRGSSGGAVHVSGSPLLFAMHCERIGEVGFDEDQNKKIADPEGKRVKSEDYPYEEIPPLKKPKKSCDSETVVRSLAGGNEGQGKAIIVSQYKRLIHYIGEMNSSIST